MKLRTFFLLLLIATFSTTTLAMQPVPQPVERIEVYKAKREMHLIREGKLVHRYTISLGDVPLGPKRKEGDEKTPEGKYTINGRNARNGYHLSLRISYPNEADRAEARKRGVSPGGDIMIHGLPNDFAWASGAIPQDWTDGCIAVSNEEMDKIWSVVPNGTPIEIFP